jgi:hypothetical protein
MTTAIQRRRGTGAQHASFTGLAGEITIDTTDYRAVVHDGVTAGGHPLAKESEVAGFATANNAALTGVPTAPTAAAATNTTQIATTAFVRTEVANLVAAAPGALDTLDELAAALGDDANFSTTVTNNLALKAPLANPTFTGTPAAPTATFGTDTTQIATTEFVQDAVAAVGGGGTPRRNRVVNPAFQISSVNGNTAGTSNGYTVADNWAVYRSTSAGTITVQRVQSTTPNGSKDRARVTITAADASLAAGEFLSMTQNILGQEVPDLLFGTASAKQVVVRFGFKGPQGTYAVSLKNYNSGTPNRSYVKLFTIGAGEANADTEQTITIPGDTTGTWETGINPGLVLDIVLAAGSTYQTTADAWQSGNFLGTSGVSNGMGTISDVFEIFDVGLYADPDSTGAAPDWELPSHDAVYDGLAITPWVAYTPTFTGFGTVTSISAFSRRVGDTLQVMVKGTPGTPTGVEARVSIGFNGTDGNVTVDSTKVPDIRHAGECLISNTAGGIPGVLMEPSVSYMTFGFRSSGSNPLTKVLANNFASSGQTISMSAQFPITGW